jgi:hypothetical protein
MKTNGGIEMTISKKELREFITKRTSNKVKEVKGEISNVINNLVEPYYKSQVDELIGISDMSILLANRLERAIDVFNINDSDITRTLSYLNYYTNDIHKTVKSDIIRKVRKVVTDDNKYFDLTNAKNDPDNYNRHLISICEKAIEEVKPFYAKIEALEKLQKELFTVIKAERTGDRAYKQLIKLGVDMENFIPEIPQLPSVTKLSVNVDLIN